MTNDPQPPSESTIRHSPSAERNAAPILAQLQVLLAAQGQALEIASGTGQHGALFAAALPGWRWQPSDWQSDAFDSIEHWAQNVGAANVLPPALLDVRSARWPVDGAAYGCDFDLVYCANMLHIAPWECCTGLMQGAARCLAPQGVLVTYGPYFESGVATAPSNAAFDADLRMRDPAWGLRNLEDVKRVAAKAGLTLLARHTMPANNLLLVFGRAGEAQPKT